MVKTLVFLLLLISHAYAQEMIPGLIPRFYSIEAASDLSMTPDEAHNQALKGVDISLLDPDPATNIWNPRRKTIPVIELVRAGEQLTYIKSLPSRSGQLRFSVQTSSRRELIIILSKKVHNFLLRRNILAKLGYETQPMSWVPSFKLNFVDSIDRDLFKEDMKDKLMAGAERWVTGQDNLTLSIQDALALTPDSAIYNLATGIMAPEIHQGRRLLRSPYVPLALVDSTESTNLMPWQAGRVVLENIKLYHTQDLDTGYGTSWEDARWIGRRISKLSRADFVEIVNQARLPVSVEKLMVEKIISRRNDLMEILNLDAQKIEFSAEVDSGKELVKGEIVQEFFPGYAGRFSYGDPESPFSSTELGSFALSQGQSELINGAISQLNNLFGTDDENDYVDKLTKIIDKDGPYFSTQAIAIPTFHANIILSRDIITGTYLGTNNKVQLVDNFGISMDAGVMSGIEGILDEPNLTVKGGASLVFQRVYSHIKPVLSLKKSLKEPYKNMYVPMLLKNIGKKIDQLTTVGPQNEMVIQSIVGELKGALAVGESFIVTDSIVPNIYAELGLSLSQFAQLPPDLLKVYARVQANRTMLSRFHLHRPSENMFQIYQDTGKNLKLIVSLKLRSYVPIVSLRGNWNRATLETQFYPVSLNSGDVTVQTLKALRQSIFSLNHDALQDVVKPYKVEGTIHGNSSNFAFLVWKRNQFGSNQSLMLEHALGGEKKQIFRRYDATTFGTDFEGYTRDSVNTLIQTILKYDASVSDVMSLNPGFSVGGKAKNKIFSSEYDGSRLITSYRRILNGWRAGPNSIKDKIALINREVGRKLFDPITVVNTNSILLYQISYQYTLTQEGSAQVTNATATQVKSLLDRYMPANAPREEVDRTARNLSNSLKKIRDGLKLANPSEGMKDLHSWLKTFQDRATLKALEELVGSENISYQGRIEGFRQGDENGDSAIFSNVYGTLPLPLHSTPTSRVIENWGIMEGELTASWMMEVAI